MYFNPFDYSTNQACLEERIQEAQACHAQQRRMLQGLGQTVNWLRRWLIAWRQHLHMQPHSLRPQRH